MLTLNGKQEIDQPLLCWLEKGIIPGNRCVFNPITGGDEGDHFSLFDVTLAYGEMRRNYSFSTWHKLFGGD